MDNPHRLPPPGTTLVNAWDNDNQPLLPGLEHLGDPVHLDYRVVVALGADEHSARPFRWLLKIGASVRYVYGAFTGEFLGEQGKTRRSNVEWVTLWIWRNLWKLFGFVSVVVVGMIAWRLPTEQWSAILRKVIETRNDHPAWADRALGVVGGAIGTGVAMLIRRGFRGPPVQS